MNVLVVEDEVRVAEFIQKGLKSEGWTVTVAPDGETGLSLLENDRFDVIVLDLMLPGIGGQDVCRRLRGRKDPTPVLMLSALDKTSDRVAGLRLGADDYLAKPFDFDELLARLEALARRGWGSQGEDEQKQILTIEQLSFDTQSLEVKCQGQLIDLSARERDILQLLMSNSGKVYSRERILNALWKVSEDPLTNVVDVYIGRLRKKLGPCGSLISTVRGAGYRLSASDSAEEFASPGSLRMPLNQQVGQKDK
jgi:DNA-binding response OmpR family regulator